MSPEAPQLIASKNVEQIAKLESEQVEARTLSERIAGAGLTRMAGREPKSAMCYDRGGRSETGRLLPARRPRVTRPGGQT